MAFCSNCGTPVSGAFCIQCGTRAAKTIAAAQSAPASMPVTAPAPQTSGGSALKILLVIGGGLFMVGLLAAASLVYVGYRAKQKIVGIADEYGLTGKAAQESAPPLSSMIPPAGKDCPILPWREASEVLGVALERVEYVRQDAISEECRFFVKPGERRRLTKNQVASGIQQVGKSGASDADQQKAVEKVMAGAFNAFQNAATDQSKDPFLSIQWLRQNGRSKWETVKSVQAGVKASTGGLGMQVIEGVGDQAYMLPEGFSISVLKGDAWFTAIFTFVPGAEKAAALGRQISTHL